MNTSRPTMTHLYVPGTPSNSQHHSIPIQFPSPKPAPSKVYQRLDSLIILAIFLESTTYLIDGLIFDNLFKIIASGINYLMSLLGFISLMVIKKNNPTDKRVINSILVILAIGTCIASVMNFNEDEKHNFLLFIPTVILKVMILIYLEIPISINFMIISGALLTGITISILHYEKRDIFDCLNGVIAVTLSTPFLLRYKNKRKEEDYKIKTPETVFNEQAFSMFGGVDEAVIVINEMGQSIYFNDSFEKIFPLPKEQDILLHPNKNQGHPKYSLSTEFIKISAVKALNPSLQDKIADVLRSENTADSITRKILRREDSPDALLISDRESGLHSLYIAFMSNERIFKANNIGFDSQTKLPKFESFTATLKKNIRETFEISFKIAYMEFNNKTYVCIVFNLNPYQNELKEIQKELEARKQILKHVAHDMRNPLSSNQLLLETAELDPSINNQTKERYIKPCIKTLKYLFALVNDLVDSALISAGKFKLVINEVSINDLIKDVIQIFELKAKPKEITLKKQINPCVPTIIYTDSSRLLQILINLVSNSLKYTQKRGMITIKVDVNILNSNKIDFSVEDTGIGIRMENQKNLLKDFSKVEGNKDSELNPYGVGLGLSISNKLAINLNVEAAQEGIKIDSAVGKGTKMKFSVENRKPESLSKIPSENALSEMKKYSENYSSSIDEKPQLIGLPKQTASNKSIGSDTAKVRKALTTLRKINELDVISSGHKLHSKVLIIDDDAFSAESVNMLLNSLGLTADKAFSTKDALKKFEELAAFGKAKGQVLGYDLIFMDAMMEDMDGFESTKLLKGKMKNGEIKEAPIVFCTGLDSESENQAVEAGAEFFVTKPISRAKLITILKKSNIETAVKI